MKTNIRPLIALLICFSLGSFFSPAGHSAITIVWGAQIDDGLGLSNGSAVAVGSSLKLGYYTTAVTSSTFSGYSSATQFLNNFVTLASASMGLDADSDPGTPLDPGYFASGASLLTGDNSATGQKLYYIVGNNSVFGNSTEVGVFTSSLSKWTLIANPTGPTPTVISTDINEVGGADILFGSGPVVGAAAYGDQYRLQAVPEPSIFSLALLGGVALAHHFRRRQK